MLSIDTIETWLQLFASLHPGTNVVFLGGEPTLHPDLSQAVKRARGLGYGSVTIDTNGYLFNDILNKVTPSDVNAISFSLDGATAATNDAIRGRGSFDRCTNGARQAAAAGFSTSLIYTVSNLNLHELERMGPLLKDLGIQRFFIQVIGLRGKSADRAEDDLQLPASLWLERVPQVAADVSRTGITVSYPKVFLAPEEHFECAGKVAHNYFIFPNGRVYRCPLCEDYPIHSLRIEDNRLLENPPINEKQLFELDIPEGCVMNKLIQPGNIEYDANGRPLYKIACCLLKEELKGR
jgi:MoaA/NifB/PqqE/SkfB family radical SAM enzyme